MSLEQSWNNHVPSKDDETKSKVSFKHFKSIEQPVLLIWQIQPFAHSRNSEKEKVLDKIFPFKEILHE